MFFKGFRGLLERWREEGRGGLFSLFFSIIFGGAVHAVLHNFVSSALLKSCGSLFFHLAYILARYLLYYRSLVHFLLWYFFPRNYGFTGLFLAFL